MIRVSSAARPNGPHFVLASASVMMNCFDAAPSVEMVQYGELRLPIVVNRGNPGFLFAKVDLSRWSFSGHCINLRFRED